MHTETRDGHSLSLLQKLDLSQIKAAIGEPSRVTYECAHVYPLSAPNFQKNISGKLERPTNRVSKLYVHVPFCNYACRFCFYAKQIGASIEQKRRMVDSLINEMQSMELGATLSLRSEERRVGKECR